MISEALLMHLALFCCCKYLFTTDKTKLTSASKPSSTIFSSLFTRRRPKQITMVSTSICRHYPSSAVGTILSLHHTSTASEQVLSSSSSAPWRCATTSQRLGPPRQRRRQEQRQRRRRIVDLLEMALEIVDDQVNDADEK